MDCLSIGYSLDWAEKKSLASSKSSLTEVRVIIGTSSVGIEGFSFDNAFSVELLLSLWLASTNP